MKRLVYVHVISNGEDILLGTEADFVLKIATDLVCGTKYSHCVNWSVTNPASWDSLPMNSVNLSGKDISRVHKSSFEHVWDDVKEDFRLMVKQWSEDVLKEYSFVYEDGTPFNPKKYYPDVEKMYHAVMSGNVKPYAKTYRPWSWHLSWRAKYSQGRHHHRFSSERQHSSLKSYRLLEEYPEYGIFLDEKEKFLSASPWWDEMRYRVSEGNWKSQTKSRNQWGVHKNRADRETIRKMSDFMQADFGDDELEARCG